MKRKAVFWLVCLSMVVACAETGHAYHALLELMQNNLRATQQILTNLSLGKADNVLAASRSLMKNARLMSRLGNLNRKLDDPDAGRRYSELAISVFENAKNIEAAALQNDMAGASKAFGEMVDDCVACHNAFRR